MTETKPGVPLNFTVEDATIYMDVDTDSLDLPRALEVIEFLKNRIADMDAKHVAQVERIAKLKREHAESEERLLQKMEGKVAARDHTIDALKDTIVRIAGDY